MMKKQHNDFQTVLAVFANLAVFIQVWLQHQFPEMQ